MWQAAEFGKFKKCTFNFELYGLSKNFDVERKIIALVILYFKNSLIFIFNIWNRRKLLLNILYIFKYIDFPIKNSYWIFHFKIQRLLPVVKFLITHDHRIGFWITYLTFYV